MKVVFPGILAGVGGIGAVGTTISIVYPTSESNEDGINDAIFDGKFENLREEFGKFADKCHDKSRQYGNKTILEELENILGLLLEPEVKYSGSGTSNLDARKLYLDKRFTEDERGSFKGLYEKMEDFSKLLKNNRQKSSEYIEKLKQN